MYIRCKSSAGLIAIILLLFCSSFSLGQSNWTGLTDVTFSNPQEFRWLENNNWSAGLPSATTGAVFTNDLLASNNVWLAGLGTATSQVGDIANFLNFNATAKSYTIRGDVAVNAPTISGLGLVGSNARITNQSVSTQVFNVGVTFFGTDNNSRIENTGSGQTSYNGTVTSTSGNLAISKSSTGAMTFNAVDASTKALTVSNSDATGAVNFNGAVTANTVAVGSSTGLVAFNSNVTATAFSVAAGAGTVRLGDLSTDTFTGPITVAGRVDGVGSIGGLLTVQNGGQYAPGVAGVGGGTGGGVGTQSVNGLAFNSGSTFVWQLDGTNQQAGINFDTVTGLTNISINSGAVSRLDISNVASSFWNTNRSWNVFTGTFAAPASVFGTIQLAGLSAPATSLGSFSWTSNANAVRLNFITAVPEPSSIALLGVAGVAGGLFARRRAKKNKA